MSTEVWSSSETPGDGLTPDQRRLLAKLRARPGQWLLYLTQAGVMWPLTDAALDVLALRRAGLAEVHDEQLTGLWHNIWVRVPAQRETSPQQGETSRQQWDPGPQPSEYGDERTAPPSL